MHPKYKKHIVSVAVIAVILLSIYLCSFIYNYLAPSEYYFAYPSEKPLTEQTAIDFSERAIIPDVVRLYPDRSWGYRIGPGICSMSWQVVHGETVTSFNVTIEKREGDVCVTLYNPK